jgi:LuxR family transcriptional regulator, maltose regulon positive regulatory protein
VTDLANATRRGVVQRHSLQARLSALPPAGVAVVSGPAGSGKTLLLRSWAEQLAEQVAWVSVEPDERDAQRFWLAVVDELAATSREGVIDRVSPTPTFHGDTVLARLLDELQLLQEPVVLVIDDLHELHSAEALRGLARFVARLPVQLRVVLGTREHMPLGLHGLRLNGGLLELGAADLRLSLQETHELVKAAGVTLSDDDVAALHERTEGWAAGVRLATISLAGHPAPARFVKEFSGSERTVAEYLLAEVLERQPREVRDLLLRTSVLTRVNGPLADALSGNRGCEGTLQQLEEANVFLTSTNASRSWFRYHHLFADLLQLELRRTAPTLVDSLHRAAAHWHEQEGDPVEAIRHAQAARDWPHAGRLLADHLAGLIFEGRVQTLQGLLAAFPRDAVESDAEIALACGAVRALVGLDEESAVHIATAERLEQTVPGGRRRLFGLRLASSRLLLARRRGDLTTATKELHAVEHALAEASEPPTARELALSSDLEAAARMNLGIALLWSLRPDEARTQLEQALELARRIQRPFLEIESLAHLAMADGLSGRPVAGQLETCERAVAIADAHGWSCNPIVAAAFTGGGEALLRLGRFAEAEQWLARSGQTFESDQPETEVVRRAALGLLRFGQERLEEALASFRTALRLQRRLVGEHAWTIELVGRKLQAQAAIGESAAAREGLGRMSAEERDWATIRIAAAAVELADEAPDEALRMLAPVLDETARALHPSSAAAEAWLFAAAAREQQGDQNGAHAAIERALGLTAPLGIVLPFMLAPVGALLERHVRHGSGHAALLATILDLRAEAVAHLQDEAGPAPHELTDAELRVVRYLATNLTAPEIASELFISSNTVRTHMRHIYAKFDAHSRREAVVYARDLGLLAQRPGV